MADWDSVYEDANSALVESLDQMRGIFATMQRPLPQRLIIEVVPERTLNAWASYRSSHAHHKVGISILTLLFSWHMSAIAAEYFPFPENIERESANFRRAAANFSNALLEMGGFRPIDQKVHWPAGELGRTVAEIVIDFITAHELSHIALGHLTPEKSRRVKETLSDVEGFNWGQADEIAADLHGIMALLAHCDAKGYRLALVMWASDFILAALGFWMNLENEMLWPLAKYLGELANHQTKIIEIPMPIIGMTHPPSELRRAALWEFFASMGADLSDPRSELGQAREMARRTDIFLTELWPSARQAFTEGVIGSLKRYGTQAPR